MSAVDAVATMDAILVDPSLFTGPYDAALNEGLLAAGVRPLWAVRPSRPGDAPSLDDGRVAEIFYVHSDQMTGLPSALRAFAKGLSHIRGLAKLAQVVRVRRPDVVHFQWTVLPLLDAAAMAIIRTSCPVVLTVHDTTPFNGDRLPFLQRVGFVLPMRIADRIIVHTAAGRGALVRGGLPRSKITIIPHGPLRIPSGLRPRVRRRADEPYTFVLFGEIKPYKGVDVLVEAFARMPLDARQRARCVVAGRARMDLDPIRALVERRAVGDRFSIDPRRYSDRDMADLFAEADCFVFPYRRIDASGVYHLVSSFAPWLIASRVGAFAEGVRDRRDGDLVPPDDPDALAAAMARAVLDRPSRAVCDDASGWAGIGLATRALYREARGEVPS